MDEIASLIKKMRTQAGLTQDALAEPAGTSQPTVAAYEGGRAHPTLGTLERLADAAGFDLQIRPNPRVRRGAQPISEAAREVKELLEDAGLEAAWRRLLDFIDDFRGSPVAGKRWLVTEEPSPTGDLRFDAAIAAVVDFLSAEASLSAPEWTDGPERFARPWWFVAGLPGLEATALRDSPIAFARHGVFVNEGAFDRV
ncbi:MAG: helix-turn-helix transcriptional regulator [Actinomycetota bacterium]